MALPREERRPDDDAANIAGAAGDQAGGLKSDTSLADNKRCRRCHHPLSRPSSIARGTGPTCHLREEVAA